MLGDPRVRELIEEILDSGSSAEDVCREAPELLPRVLEGWRRLQAVQDQVSELFPDSRTAEYPESTRTTEGLPEVPGYDVSEILGRGGVGVVYKAWHLRLNRPVALKMLLAGACASREERQRFSREAELVAGLRHPNIVQVYDVDDLEGRPYFTMEFVEGGSLDRELTGTPWLAREAASLLAILAEAIRAAHQGGIVHRDLKPSNILRTADGTPKISDFGLARHLEVGSELTQSGAAVGTPSYMSPEQARGKTHETGPAADLYALGSILYELLTGRPPFRAETAAETLHQVITQDPVPPSKLNGKVPRDLETICLKCLRKDPQLRYDGAASLAEDLRRFLHGEAIAARPESRLEWAARRVRRRPIFSAAIAAGTLVGMTLVGIGLWLVLERAETTRRGEAERAAMERAAGEELKEMARWLEKSSWPEAAASLERAKVRLGDREAPELRRRIERGAWELALVARLDAITLDRAESIGGVLGFDAADEKYATAFRESGIGSIDEAPEVVAARIKALEIREALVASLDSWTASAREPRQQDWLLTVARLADRDPTGWSVRARDPATWKDKATLAEVIAAAPVARQSVPLLLALESHLYAFGENPVPFLNRIQQAHPGDFWVNLKLGQMLISQENPKEAIGFLRVALAIKPGTSLVRNNLGMALMKVKRLEEAAGQLRHAVRIDPTAPHARQNLVAALHGQGKFEEAMEHIPELLRLNPKSYYFHALLAVSLNGMGHFEGALEEFRRSVALDPKYAEGQRGLRAVLVNLARFDELRDAWESSLATDPPEHAGWYGYAELCLFLGREEDYRRARQALLAKFGENTSPAIAERTARACLLLPASDDEMRKIVALGERAWNVDRSKALETYPYYQFVRGLASYRQGDLDRAISVMQSEPSHVLRPAPQLVLAMAQYRSGRVAEARKTLAEAMLGCNWRKGQPIDQDGWIYHVLRREAESLILPDLPSFLEGKHQPQDNDERIALLGICQATNRHLVSARLYREILNSHPNKIQDLGEHAARAAALVGSGRSEDASGLSDRERERWRERAREWLRATLNYWSQAANAHPAESREVVRQNLARLRSEPDLAALREPAELEKWPVDERQDCLKLWEEVEALLKRTESVPIR